MRFKPLFNKRILFFASIALVGGILAAALPMPYNLLVYGCLLLVTAFLFCHFRFDWVILITMLVMAVVGNARVFLQDTTPPQYVDSWSQGVQINGRVCECPRVYPDYIQYILDDLVIDGQAYPHRMTVRMMTDSVLEKDYNGGDVLSFFGEVVLEPDAVSEAVSYRANFINDRVAYTAETHLNLVVKTGYRADLMTPLIRYKARLINVFSEHMSKDNAQLTTGILLGSGAQIDRDIRNDFNATGISHILSVSGLHVGFLLLILRFIFKKIKVSPVIEFICSTGILLVYTALTGFSAPVLRAGVMGEMFLLSGLVGRRHDILTSLSFSAILILLVKPFLLFDASFILSVMSMLGIIFLCDRINGVFRVRSAVVRSLSLTASGQLGALPAVSYYFGGMSALSFLANLVIVPLSALLVYGGMLCMVVDLIKPGGAGLFVGGVDYLAGLILYLVKAIAGIELSAITVPFMGFGASAVYILLMWSMSKYLLVPVKRRLILGVGLSVYMVALALFTI